MWIFFFFGVDFLLVYPFLILGVRADTFCGKTWLKECNSFFILRMNKSWHLILTHSISNLHCKSYLNWWSCFSLGRYVLVLWNQMLQSTEPNNTEFIPELATLLLTAARNPGSVQTFGNGNLWVRAPFTTVGSTCPAVPGGHICFVWHLISRCIVPSFHAK